MLSPLLHTHTHNTPHTETHPSIRGGGAEVGACLGIFSLNLCAGAVETRLPAEALLCHGNTNF